MAVSRFGHGDIRSLLLYSGFWTYRGDIITGVLCPPIAYTYIANVISTRWLISKKKRKGLFISWKFFFFRYIRFINSFHFSEIALEPRVSAFFTIFIGFISDKEQLVWSLGCTTQWKRESQENISYTQMKIRHKVLI